METELENELNTVHEMQNHYKHDIHKMEDRNMNEWSNVHCNDYASKGLAGTALGVGLGGLVGSLLNTGCSNGLGGLFGGGCREKCVTQTEFDLAQRLSKSESENGLLKSQVYTDQKLSDSIRYLDGKIERLEARVVEDEKNQLVFNGTVNTAIAQINGTNNCQQAQINELLGLTARVVPNASVCPGWGPVCTQPIPCPSAAGTALAGTDCRK